VYNNTLATVKRQIQQGENPMPAVVISMEAAHVENAILLDYLTSEVVLEEPKIGSTHPNIPIDNNCTDDELHFGMPGGSRDYEDAGDERDDRDAIPTLSQQQWPATELLRFDLGTSDVDGYEGEDGDDADVDAAEEEKSSQVDDGSTRMWRTDLGPSDVDGYDGQDGDDADADEEEEASQADDGSKQNVED
jgi:hypothetical protein